ncbi:MAG: hypothetical protein IPI43_23615 [Sandaracinaceae bacterium]|nr:hypothetical protein [Sandaracinaceae bacterium]
MMTRLLPVVLGLTPFFSTLLAGCGTGGGTVDPPPEEDWTGCPTAAEHVADPSWNTTFVEAEDLVLCTVAGENNSASPIAEVFRQKLMLRLPAGTYRLPNEETSGAYTLPLCTRSEPGGAAQGIDGPGSVSREGSIIATQPLAIGDARMSIYDLAAGKTLEVCVDGDGCSLDEGTGVRLMGADCQPDASAWATPRPDVFRRRRLTVAFEGGELTFDVVTIVGSDNPDIIGLYPVAGPLLSVEGNFNGAAIDTNNYWEMSYWAAHHVFGQYFGVVLPSPDGDTCALEVAEGVFSEPPSYTVYRLDCDFERIGELAFESVTSEEL